MQFLIADSLTSSLARLTAEEQKAAKTSAFDFQMNPKNPGHQLHRIDNSKDKNFWSARVNRDIRLIIHQTAANFVLCYVDHHDDAYAWAEKRKLETHPTTGAAQFVVIEEQVKKRTVYQDVFAPPPSRAVSLASVSDEQLLGYGIPPDWLKKVRSVTNEDELQSVAEQLPGEAAEALLQIAFGTIPEPRPVEKHKSPFEHPDAQRRFRIVSDLDELKRALDYPWEKWTVFLHPAQREFVEKKFGGPARVAGSAGTGKTVVALHRAAHVARENPDARVLLTTFSDTLANSLRINLQRLAGSDPKLIEQIDVDSVDGVAVRLHAAVFGKPQLIAADELTTVMETAMNESPDLKFSRAFILSEWNDIIDAWQIDSWESYRDVARLGRKTRLTEKQRQALWRVFEKVRQILRERGSSTRAELYYRLAAHYELSGKTPYDFVIVDEAQDVSVPQMRFIAALRRGRPDALFFAGDLGQRIFQLPFSWKALGVDVRGRSATLRVNYRTSHQIRTHADRLLGESVSDVDGEVSKRAGTVSVFNGPVPQVQEFESQDAEVAGVASWLQSVNQDGVEPSETGVFIRSEDQIPRASAAIQAAGLESVVLRGDMKARAECVSIGTMHMSKGLEFKAVAVMACDDEVIPLQERIESVTDESDLKEVFDTERHLLYVACTRARDHLHVSGVKPVSEFLRDLT